MKDLHDCPVGTPVTRAPRRSSKRSARRFKRILVPIDFSRPSLKAIPYALAISRQFNADVHLLHVVDTTQLPAPTLLTLPLAPQAEWNKRFMDRLQALASKYKTTGRVHVLQPCEGRAYEEICARARQLRADLIVIATHGYTGYKRTLLGSTAERVVQHSPCPVLVVRQHLRHLNGATARPTRNGFPLARILVPIDFSNCSTAAFNYAAGLAQDFNAELRLVHAINPNAYPFGDKYTALDVARLLVETTDAAQRAMRSIAAKSRARYSVRVVEGSPATQICNAANDDVDLIVICTHGRTGIGHLLIGSVAEHVVRYAHGPVLVIPSRPMLKSLKAA